MAGKATPQLSMSLLGGHAGGETERKELCAGGILSVGDLDSKDLRHTDKGVRFSAKAEAAGTGGDRRPTAGEGAGVVKSRGQGDVGDSPMNEGVILTLSLKATHSRQRVLQR